MENSTREGHSTQAPTDLGTASLPPSLTAQTRGSTVDHREQQPADLRSAPYHSVTAQPGGNAVVPQLTQCHVRGDINLTVNIPPGHTGAKQELTNPEMELGGKQTDASPQQPNRKTNEAIIKDQQTLKSDLKKRFARIFDELRKENHHIPLNEIFTELYITEGGSGGVNNEHEMRWIETEFKKQASQETQFDCNDIFKLTPGDENTIRTVLTKGIAGIGKTVSVQKFILDWVEGKANQDIDLIFTLPFRDLNLKKEKEFSLMELLQHYFPKLTFQNYISLDEIKSLDCKVKVLFIFDGLDECQPPLDFQKNETCFDVTMRTSVEKLLTNLILGNLLPSALLWITSRPAAANQIPPEYIIRMTKVRGFNDPQKEEYFKKRFRDQSLAGRVISHIKTSKSLYIMCHIPVLCRISAAVLETVFGGAETEVIPKSLTEMYTHFLLIQMNMNKKKYHSMNETNSKNMSASDVEIILKLGKLAFRHLKRGTLIFSEKDLSECDIDFTKASMHSGLCTQIFKDDSGLYREKVFCFVHLSIQEYMAALFVFHSCVNGNINLLSPESLEDPEEDEEDSKEAYAGESPRVPLSDLYCSAVDEALKSDNGHLDLFLQFLLGLSLESTQALLQDFLTHPESSSLVAGRRRNKSPRTERRNLVIKCVLQSYREKPFSFGHTLRDTESTSHVLTSLTSTKSTVQLIKEKIKGVPTAERIQNLFHCLNELNDNSLVEEIETSLRSGKFSNVKLDPGQCSAVAFVLLMSQDVLDVFDLKTYNTSEAGQLRLLPVVRNCRRAMLSDCNLTEESCKIVASAVQLDSSPLVELDLSHNGLGDSGVELLCAGLRNPNCKLQIIRLSGCQVTERGCASLASALSSNPSHLRELDLSYNHKGESGVRALSAALEDPSCRLEKLKLSDCNLTEESCKIVASAVQLDSSPLVELDLSHNDLGDSGMELLCAGLRNPNCKLQIIRLSGCQVTERGCASLASALSSNPSHLRELDLSSNHPGESGVRALSAALEDPSCRLEKLNVDHGGENRLKPGPRKYACQLTLDPNTAHKELILSDGNRKVTRSEGKEEPYPDHPERFVCYPQVLCREGLTGRCYWEVEWTGGENDFAVGVAYQGISRNDLVFLHDTGNIKSWSLAMGPSNPHSWVNGKCHPLSESSWGSRRVGVYLNWPAGILSFFRISDTLTHLHTFHTTFTEPVYPVFRVSPDSSLSLCMLG
ncbi:NACHT, LRR and PYD domains-containing protein 12-like [Conger conger]|uniref:NACHT, LRR and PYD domains-containing protein 12-like n=1 Tax=Conger conger TaxID=82655 RepID=UPI002A59FAA3|nr:NACHT, LRR and PYD domains-containing protein 12-like [Conger conger]